ncbi:glycoside hydrolase family 7 protein [Amanita thiersii Skay4041]|uniref:Glucanase n=1 Tax=Amanita thiersii Skay4041 TaxID=703135 RepID=A0A2A9NZT0_9AGAR|nr:glycoside hydrolase family 7 protein [Amanita thiersii Skay4041]
MTTPPPAPSEIRHLRMTQLRMNSTNAQETAFGNTDPFEFHGGLGAMSSAFSRGMVLVMNLWNDHEANMLWLNSNYSLDKDSSLPGVAHGPCSSSAGLPIDIESQSPSATVTFPNIRYGDIGSIYAPCFPFLPSFL